MNDHDQKLVIGVVRSLELQQQLLLERAMITGALPGEVGIVMRLGRLPGRGFVDSMRMDFN